MHFKRGSWDLSCLKRRILGQGIRWSLVSALALGSLARAEIPVVPDWSEDQAAGTGFFDPEVGGKRREAFLAAAAYLGSLFSPSYPGETIRVKASFSDLGDQTVGAAAPVGFTNGFGSRLPLYQANTDYAFALANHLAGRELVPGNTVEMSFNSNPAITFDYSTNSTSELGSTSESLYTTAVHEIAHGIGFLSYFNPESGSLEGFPTAYDRWIVLGRTDPVKWVDLTDAERLAAITSDDLYWAGPRATAANGGVLVKLYAPDPYSDGSSVSHLDTVTFDPLGLLLLPRDSPLVKGLPYLTALERAMLYEMGFTPALPRLALTRSGEVSTISFVSILGAKYRLLQTAALTSTGGFSGWVAGSEVVAGTGGTVSLRSTGAGPGQFYAVEIVP